jgi:hypothetical protein
MAQAVGFFSTRMITPKGLARVIQPLGGVENAYGWEIARNGRAVHVELAHDELEMIPDDIVLELADELGGVPESLVVVVLNDQSEDGFDWQLTRAVGIALAEHYPIVLHDYMNPPETLYGPGQRPAPDYRNN